MEIRALDIQKREGRGSRQATKLRKQGLVPGVVYGHNQATVSVAVEYKPLVETIRQGVTVVEIKEDGRSENAQIVAVQWDYLGKDILHFDLKRVNKDERISISVRVELKGIPAGVTAGGQLDWQMHTLHVECFALAVPDVIKVNVADLQVDDAIHVKDVKLPNDVTALDDAEAVVVHVIQRAPEPEPGTEGTAPEPEVIRRAKEEEGEEK